MRAGTVDAVHAGTAVALGQHGGALVGIQLRHCRADIIAQHHARAGVVRIHPHIIGVVRGVVETARGGAALGGHHRFGAHDDIFPRTHVPAQRAACPAAVRKNFHRHDPIQHVHAAGAHNAGHDALDGHAVGDVTPPCAGLTEALGAMIAAVGGSAEIHAALFQHVEDGPHVIVPAVGQHGGSPAVQGFGVKPDQIVRGIERRILFVHDGHIMVVAAADAAGTFQFALVYEHDIESLFLRADGRAAAGSSGPDHQHVGFNQRAERMRRIFHKSSCETNVMSEQSVKRGNRRTAGTGSERLLSVGPTFVKKPSCKRTELSNQKKEIID